MKFTHLKEFSNFVKLMVNFLHVKHEMAVILRAETPGGMGGRGDTAPNLDKVCLVGHDYRNSSGEFLEKRTKYNLMY